MTDALRNPAHKLAAGSTGRAVADLVFLDREQDGTGYRTCVVRRGPKRVRTCFNATSGKAGAANVTPLRFPRGRYVVSWTATGDVVARWSFRVV